VQQLIKIWRFGTPFLRPYLPRFVFGVVLGVIFGLSNGLFVLAVNGLFNRLAPAESVSATTHLSSNKIFKLSSEEASSSPWRLCIRNTVEAAKSFADRWRPATGQAFTWQRALGGFFLLPLIVGLRALTNYLSTYCLTWVSARVIRDMQLAALRKVQELSIAFYQKRTVSDLYARISTDTKVIYDSMTNGFIDTIREPFALLSILGSMLWVDWKLTLISVGMLPLVAWPIVSSGRRLKALTKRFSQQTVQQTGGLLEALSAVRIVKAYSMELAQQKSFLELANHAVTLSVKRAQIRNILNPLIETLSMFGVGFLILFVFYTAASPNSLVTFLAALLLTPLSIKRLADLHLTLQSASVSSERLEELFAETPTVSSRLTPFPSPNSIRASGSMASPSPMAIRMFCMRSPWTFPRGRKSASPAKAARGKAR
jgi:subfamily B ATP-binding cassette protein MsbA